MLEFVEVPQRYVVGVRRQVSAEELSDLHEHAFNETAEVLAQAQAQPGTSCCYFLRLPLRWICWPVLRFR